VENPVQSRIARVPDQLPGYQLATLPITDPDGHRTDLTIHLDRQYPHCGPHERASRPVDQSPPTRKTLG
jgi:hypothetical protein